MNTILNNILPTRSSNNSIVPVGNGHHDVVAQYRVQLETFLDRSGLAWDGTMRRGPFTAAFLVYLYDPSQTKMLLKMQSEIAMVMRARVQVKQVRQGILIEVELPHWMHATPNARKLADRACNGSELAVGLSSQGNPVTVTLNHEGSFWWIGAPGRGKSMAMMSFVYCALRSLPGSLFFACASKAKIEKDWWKFGRLKGCLGLVSNYSEMEAALEWAWHMMKSGLDRKLFVVIDDMTVLTSRIDVTKLLDDFALEGRDINCHLVVGTHGAGSKDSTGLSTKGRNGMTFKVMYGSADNTSDARSAGRKHKDTGIDQLSGYPGDAALVTLQGNRRIGTPWIDDADILALPTSDRSRVSPWVRQHQRPQQSPPPTPQQPQGTLQPLIIGDEPHPIPTYPARPQPVPASGVCVDQPGSAVREIHTTGGVSGDVDDMSPRERAEWRDRILRRLPDCFPINKSRALIPDEDKLIWSLSDRGFTENELMFAVWGKPGQKMANARSPKRREIIQASLARRGGKEDASQTDEVHELSY